MANYALLSNGKVVNHVLADSIEAIGEAALIYDVVDITTAYPQPSVNWTLEDGNWLPPKMSNKTMTDWVDAATVDPDAVLALAQAAVKEIAAPSKEKSK